MANKKWSDLSTRQRRVISVVGAVEAVMTVAALVDLGRRPASRVRGPKAALIVGAFVQPVGPIVYFVLGRRPAS